MKISELRQVIKEELNNAIIAKKWNELDDTSKENLLLGFIKEPDEAIQLASLAWDNLPDSVSGNKDFQDNLKDYQ